MVEAFVITTVEGLLKKVLSIAASEVALALGFQQKLTNLHQILYLIHSKLHNAVSDTQKGREVVMVWLKQLNHVASETYDVLDEVHYEMLRREVKKRDKVTCLPILKNFSFRRELGLKIEHISKKLFEINKQANDLGLQIEQPDLFPDGLCHETSPDPYLEKFKIVGRKDDELHIIQLLTQSQKEEKLVILPVVGVSGIGKTTLVKSIYVNPKIKQHFDVRAWLCVSAKVEIDTLLSKIYETLFGHTCKLQTRASLLSNLRRRLGSYRYLLVLDDVWDEEMAYWDYFRTCMLIVNSKKGSKILVTTRKYGNGTMDMARDSIHLKGLPDDESWSIFREKAFVTGQLPFPELEKIGRDIVTKCCGSPLIVNVLGGILRKYNDKEKWLSIRDNKVWDLEEEGDKVHNILKLSFDNLPNSVVQQCFAYCSIFEKNTIIEREELIQLWMALRFVQADEGKNKDLEDVGNDIFEILVRSSFLQDVTRDEYGYITHCGMHDLVHDLLLSLSNHESLRLVGPRSADIEHIHQVKYLGMHRYWKDDGGINISYNKIICTVFEKVRSLHTLFFLGDVDNFIPFQRLKCLRILKLNGCKLEMIDDSIGELVHLRYLDLSHTQIHVLPRIIGELFHLQTLKLNGCYYLNELPKHLGNLISLRDLEFSRIIPTRNLGKLTSLRNLSCFIVGQEKGCRIEELGPLKHLGGNLCISNLEEVNSKEDAAKADLFGKKNLSKIEFVWSSDERASRKDNDVLEGLQLPTNVKSLTIENYSGDYFPTWLTKMAISIEGQWTPLHKLVDITLSGCQNCLCLPILEYLPLLRDLVLRNMDNLTCLSESTSMNPLSPSLRSIELQDMKRLENWINGATTNSSTMLSPVLERLLISFCPSIVFLDECHLHPLVSLKIWYCESLVRIKSIQGLTSLESLVISNCPSLLAMPNLHNHPHPLKSLIVTNLTSFPSDMFDYFAFLKELELGPFSEELHCFPSLQGIEKLWNHLHSLHLKGWSHWESIPEEVKYMRSLDLLTITGFGIQELPIWLANMSSIRHLRFYECRGLDKEKIRHEAPRGADKVEFNGSLLRLSLK